MLGYRIFGTLVEWARHIISGGDVKLYAFAPFQRLPLSGLGLKTSKLDVLLAHNP